MTCRLTDQVQRPKMTELLSKNNTSHYPILTTLMTPCDGSVSYLSTNGNPVLHHLMILVLVLDNNYG